MYFNIAGKIRKIAKKSLLSKFELNEEIYSTLTEKLTSMLSPLITSGLLVRITEEIFEHSNQVI